MKNDQYVITGHTSGIGKALYDRLCHSSIGFSLSTGHDINDPISRKEILDACEERDTLINCAHSHYGQIDLLKDWFSRYHNYKNKTIIVVGSRIAEYPRILREDLISYQIEKYCLKKSVELLYSSKRQCHIVYKWFGYVGTEKILKKYPHFTKNDYISIDAAVDLILK